MSEHSSLPSRGFGDLTYHDLQQLDVEQALEHQLDRTGRRRREHFPKDDRRSSAMLTERERAERWPIG